jgi:transporter family-2 protein
LKAFCIVAALLAGFALPFQAAANAALGKHTPSMFQAALINFIVGGLLLAVVSFVAPAKSGWTWDAMGQTPWWGWVGGLIGATYVTMAVKTAPVLGTVLMLGVGIAGQMVGSVTLDHFGLMGLARRPVSMERIAGISLLIMGSILILRGR